MKTVRFQSKIVHSERINPLFTKVKIHAAYDGLNRNNSYISKDTFDKAAPTAKFCPIVGEWSQDIQDFKDHGGKIEIDDEGIKFVNTTIPYGCIGDESPTWETVELPDGTTREYFTLIGYLWTERFPELESLIEDKKSHSMEVNVDKGSFQELGKDNVYVIEDMIFSGFCILGDEVEPCFEDSKIATYSLNKDEFKKQFNQMVSELKSSLSGDFKMADKKKNIKIDNSKDAANMTGSWSSVNKTALEHKLTEASNAKALVDEGYLIVDSDWENAPSEALHYPHHEVKGETLVVHKAGLEAAYERLMQNDPHNKKALAHVKRHYRELGLDMSSFELEGGNEMEKEKEFDKKEPKEKGDNPKEENQETKTDENEEQKEEKMKSEYEVKIKEANDKFEALKGEHESLKQEFEKAKKELEELEELRTFKADKLKEEREDAENALFDKFSSELTEDDVKDLKEKASEFELEDLEDKLFALAGRKKVKFNLDKKEERIHMGVFSSDVKSEAKKDVWAEQKEKYNK